MVFSYLWEIFQGVNYRGHVIVAHACLWIQGRAQRLADYAASHIHSLLLIEAICPPSPHCHKDNNTKTFRWWSSEVLSFFFLFVSHSIHPATSYSQQLSPGMCTSQTNGLFSFSQETLWDDSVRCVMFHFLCLHIHMSQDFISVL